MDGPLDEERKWRHFVTGRPEDLTSTLLGPNLDILTLVLRILATAIAATAVRSTSGMTARQVVEFLALSWAAHQAAGSGRRALTAPEIECSIADLLRTELVVADTEGQLALTDLGRLAGAGMVSARSVLLLADFIGKLPVDFCSLA